MGFYCSLAEVDMDANANADADADQGRTGSAEECERRVSKVHQYHKFIQDLAAMAQLKKDLSASQNGAAETQTQQDAGLRAVH